MRRNIQKIAFPVYILIICILLLPLTVVAATDNSRNFVFELTVNGATASTVSLGDELSFQVMLKRTDEGRSGDYTMYSMQDEIIFNSSYFSLVEGSVETAAFYDFNVRTLEDGVRNRIILSRVVVSPAGALTQDNLVIATFRLKALTPIQGELITSRNYKVNTQNGDTYVTTSNDVNVTIKGPGSVHYAVVFEGGPGALGTAPSVGGQAEGDQFKLPDNTFRKDGCTFAGWNDGTKTYADGDTYTMPGFTVTFTAWWKEDSGSDTAPGGGEVSPGESTGSPRFDVIIDEKEKGRNVTLDENDEGMMLCGDDLSDITLHVTKADKKGRLDIDTDEKEVLIKETPGGDIEAFTDPDDDGVFDTPIAQADFDQEKNITLIFILIAAGLIAAVVVWRLVIIYRNKHI